MVLLFLDFDGVLHPNLPRPHLSEQECQYFSFLPRLEAVLRDYPEVLVVVSSDWRKHHDLEGLRNFFSPELRSRVIGTTPVEPHAGSIIGIRQREVERYMYEEGLVGVPWLALDDISENYLSGALLVTCADQFKDAEEAALRTALSDLRAM